MRISGKTSTIVLLAVVTQVACTSTLEIEPDYIGIAHLQSEQATGITNPLASELQYISSSDEKPKYRIEPQDELIINVWGRDDLGSQIPTDTADRIRTTKVQSNGDISLPVVGLISIMGKTIDQARNEIQQTHYKQLEVFHIDVQLHSCRSQAVYTAGAVNRPGLHYLCDNMATLGDVLSAAEGLTADASEDGGILKRDGKTYNLGYPLIEKTNLYHNIVLQAGDFIFFPRITDSAQSIVHLFGEVVEQGSYVIPPQGMTILGALGQASGLDNITAEIGTIYITRQEPGSDDTTTYQATMAELLENPDIQLVNGDRVFVAPRGVTRWHRWWRQAIPSIVPRARID